MEKGELGWFFWKLLQVPYLHSFVLPTKYLLDIYYMLNSVLDLLGTNNSLISLSALGR